MRLRSALAASVLALPLSMPVAPATSMPHPEAIGWLLMLVGFGATGAMLRMRRSWAADPQPARDTSTFNQ